MNRWPMREAGDDLDGEDPMAAKVSTLNVATQTDLQQAIMSYVAQGYVVSNQTEDATTLFKKKEFNVVWAVIGFFLCLLPLLIYCIVYASQSDEMMVIRVDPAAAAANPTPMLATPAVGAVTTVETLTWSEDRKFWWDGSTWIRAEQTIPPGAQLSPDSTQWWDGHSWRTVPSTDSAPSESPMSADDDGIAQS
jgi:hypothetical protein